MYFDIGWKQPNICTWADAVVDQLCLALHELNLVQNQENLMH